MQKYAEIREGRVVSFPAVAKGFTFEQCYTKSFIAQCMPCNAEVQIGWILNGSMLVPPPDPELPTTEDVRAAKLAEIVAGANDVKSALSASYSVLEEETWPQQEAGARSILSDESNVKDDTAALILALPTLTTAAVALVQELAARDGSPAESFAARIVANAETVYQAGITTLLEQRGYESAAKAAQTVEDIQAVSVVYTVRRMLEGQAQSSAV